MKKYNGLTYFDKSYLDKYNDFSQLERKEKFFANFSYKYYMDFIKSVGYTTGNESNYKFGQRIVNSKSKFWITTDENKKLKIKRFNPKCACFYDEIISPRINREIVRRHCFQMKMKKRKHYEFYKHKDKYEGYEQALINIGNCHKKIYGSTIKEDTNVIFFDLDQHNENDNADEKFNLLLELLNIKQQDVLFKEQNIFNNGIHTAIKIPYRIKEKEFYSLLKSKLFSLGLNVDCNFYNTVLRLPLSYEYNPINLTTNEYIETFQEFVNSIDYLKVVKSPLIEEIYRNTHLYISNEYMRSEVKKTIVKDANYWQSNRRVFEPSKLKINIKDSSISAGNRYNLMSLIVPQCVQRGLSLEETADYIISIDNGSKDIKKWNKSGLMNNIRKYYNKCKKNPRSVNLSSFISNQKYIPNNIASVLNNQFVMNRIIDLIKIEYMNERKKHYSHFSFSDEKLNNLNIQLPFIVKEVIGSYFFQIKNIDNKISKVIDTRFIPFIGFQLSDVYMKRIIKESTLLNGLSKDCSLSVQYIKKAILNVFNFKLIQLDKRKNNWVKGFCKSFDLSINTMFAFVKSITDYYKHTRQYNNMIKFLFLYINEYILLNGLQGFQEKLQKMEADWIQKYSFNAPPD